MNYSYKLDADVLTFSLVGRLDTEALLQARNVFFPNIQNIVGEVKYLISVIDNLHKV
jgi:hypothetical protein